MSREFEFIADCRAELRPARFAATLALLFFACGPISIAQQLPSTVYVWPTDTASQNVMMSTLAGIVNRNTNGELLLSPNNGSLPSPQFWLNELKSKYPQVQSQIQSSPSALINRYKNMLSGYVLYDRASNPDSVNIATSIAGVTNSIAVDSSTQLTATLAGLPQVADARNMTYAQAYAKYGAQFNRDQLFHNDTGKNELLRDYAVMQRGFLFYSDPTSLGTYAGGQHAHGRIYGWGASEQALFSQASQNNQQIVASDYSWSSSTTAKWQVPLKKQQYHPAATTVTQPGKHYVAFVMSDGDNVQWLTSGFPTDPKWFGSPYRGNFDMTWDLSGTLAEMNPVALNYLYEHAANNAHQDNFVAASGAGITFPSIYPEVQGLADSIGESMEKSDLKVVSVLDTQYSSRALNTILDEPQVIGMMYKTYDAFYKGRGGALQWHNGKPILSAKYSLWDGADTAQSIATALNNQTHHDGLNDSASYSIVNVHPWSTTGPDGTGAGDPMSNLNQLVQWLDPSKVEVVTLEELMLHLRNNFGTPLYMPGDFNDDGTVNTADYVFWRKSIGTAAKYQEWRMNYGRTANAISLAQPPQTGIPEPGSAILLMVGAWCTRTVRHR